MENFYNHLQKNLFLYTRAMKLQKYLSHAGICSRRKAEEYIADWKITVNGSTAHIGQIIDPEKDIVKIADSVVEDTWKLVYYKMNKPYGVVSTCVAHGETGLLDIIDVPERVFPIGRLDKETTWLILLTNDGRLSNYLMHPRYEHEKEYMVETFGPVDDAHLDAMRKGVVIPLKEGKWQYERTTRYKTRPCSVERIASGKFTIILKEGKNRQIRKMVEVGGYTVKRLKRIRIENVTLGKLEEGEYVKLTEQEKQWLLQWIKKFQTI